MQSIFNQSFFSRDVLEVAPQLPGKTIGRIIHGERKEFIITEVEAYRGTEDLACHASKGRTRRTEIMYHEGGHIYMYLIYGMYWMLNIVTGTADNPQAILVRSLQGVQGPGRVSRALELDGSFYGEKIFIQCGGELYGAENCIWAGCYRAGKDVFDRQRHVRCWGDGRRIGYGWCEGNGGCEGYGGGEARSWC